MAEVTAQIGIYRKDTERCLRSLRGCTADLSAVRPGCYAAFAFRVRNTKSTALTVHRFAVRINGGCSLPLAGCTLLPGAAVRLHVRHEHMSALGPAFYQVRLYADDRQIAVAGFTLTDPRLWQQRLPLPTSSQIRRHRTDCRAPYITLYPQHPQKQRWSEISVDFKTDHAPRGTYISVCNWGFDYSRSQRSQVQEAGRTAGYCGFQINAKGKPKVILSLWDRHAAAPHGQPETICARQLYPKPDGAAVRFGGEGVGVHCLRDYPWRTGTTYRIRVRLTPHAGTTLVSMWICDPANGHRKKLIEFDTGFDHLAFSWYCAFLENYLPVYAAHVRSMELRNIMARDEQTGAWHRAEDGHFVSAQPQTERPIRYSGRYAWGKDGDTFWAVTTGL